MVVNAIVDEPTANLLEQVNFAQQAIMSASEFCTLGPKAQEAMREAYHNLEEVKDMVIMKQRVAAFNEWWNDDLKGDINLPVPREGAGPAGTNRDQPGPGVA